MHLCLGNTEIFQDPHTHGQLSFDEAGKTSTMERDDPVEAVRLLTKGAAVTVPSPWPKIN